ncbi:unnamed protein product [Ilex paraguariensis]
MRMETNSVDVDVDMDDQDEESVEDEEEESGLQWPCRWSSWFRTPAVCCVQVAERVVQVATARTVLVRSVWDPNPPLLHCTFFS